VIFFTVLLLLGRFKSNIIVTLMAEAGNTYQLEPDRDEM